MHHRGPLAIAGAALAAGALAAVVSQIVRRPGAFYVNVHTADFPAGAVRGRLRR